jgi:2-dehydro-3-deoxyphosphogluconate aldolase / (4S)-4-hydroxy-2-oxoglutarate aldolase
VGKMKILTVNLRKNRKLEKLGKKLEKLKENKIIAVVRSDKALRALEIANALIKGGMKRIEIAVSFKEAFGVIEELSKNQAIAVTAGSVITNNQAHLAIKAGAKLIVSPVAEINLVKFCKSYNVQVITAVSTPNEAYSAWKAGVNTVKIFPAKALGGPDYIKDILTPMPFLNLIPAGGVGEDLIDYFKAGATAVSMARALYSETDNADAITAKAEKIVQSYNKYRESFLKVL